MTVSTTSNRISYNGDASSTVFSFPYKFLATGDLKVYVGDVLQTITTDYSVGTPSDTGANVTFVSPPAAGTDNIVIVRDSDLLQQAALKSNGKFPAETVEDMVDKVTLIAQRIRDLLTRSFTLSDSDTTGASLTVPTPAANRAIKWSSDGLSLVNSTYDPDDAVTDASTFANAAANSAISAAASEAGALGYLQTFQGQYYGDLSADPTLDPLGNPIGEGDLYWNTSSLTLRIYNGVAWQNTATATPASFTADTFSGTGAQTAFTLSATPASVQSLIVFISGVRQTPTTDYTFSGTTLNFVAAPPAGTGNITTLVVSALAVGTPDNDSVSTAKIQNNAVTTAKIAALAVTLGNLAANIFNGLTAVTPAADDYVVIADTSDSGNTKKSLISSLLALVTKVNVRTAIATTSGTAHQYLSIPSNAWKVSGKLSGVSANGTSGLMIQVGDSGGFKTSGYLGCESTAAGASAIQNSTGFIIKSGVLAANVYHGRFELELIDATTNTWSFSSNIATSNTTQVGVSGGSVVLSGTFDRIRLTTVSGDAFDLGLFGITEHLT